MTQSDLPVPPPPSDPAVPAVTVPGGLLDLSAAFEDALAAIEKREPRAEGRPDSSPHAAPAAAADSPAEPVQPSERPVPAALAAQLAIAQHELERARADNEELRRSYGRASSEAAHAQADLASLRRMIARTEQDLPQQTARRLLDGLLPALDHLTTVSEYLMLHEPLTDHGRQAVEMLNAEWRRALQRIQLEPFDALGMPFDPQRHEIIARVADPMHPDATVLRQAARGYLHAGRLLRSAQVVVNAVGAVARSTGDLDV
ncbi:MAG: nucleotide exchange factor GrpE [Deltaproteobacteria bacterium]|nr:nucleotide exchange factor GrpE [Deltaproteobacteria bacterium]